MNNLRPNVSAKTALQEIVHNKVTNTIWITLSYVVIPSWSSVVLAGIVLKSKTKAATNKIELNAK
jgi:hypothetical protein